MTDKPEKFRKGEIASALPISVHMRDQAGVTEVISGTKVSFFPSRVGLKWHLPND